MATDLVQRTREALVAVLDTAAPVVALSGRASANVVAWESLSGDDARPVLAYSFIAETGSPLLNARAFVFQLSAIAAEGDEAAANELLHAALAALTQPALEARGLQGFVFDTLRQRVPNDPEAGASRADADLTFVVSS